MKQMVDRIKAFAKGHKIALRITAVLLSVALVFGALYGTGALQWLGSRLQQAFAGDDGTSSQGGPQSGVIMGDYNGPELTVGGWLIGGTDYSLSDSEAGKKSIDTLLAAAREYGLTGITVPLYSDDGVIYSSHLRDTVGFDYLNYIIEAAHKNMLAVYVVYDVMSGAGEALNVCDDTSVSNLCAEIENICHSYNVDGMLLYDYHITDTAVYKAYYDKSGGGMGLDQFCRDKLTLAMRKISQTVYATAGGIFCGIVAEPLCYSSAVGEDGMAAAQGMFDAYADGHADIVKWVSDGFIKFILVENYRRVNDTPAFGDISSWWSQKFGEGVHVCYSLAADKVAEWKNPAELSAQFKLCMPSGGMFRSLSALANDKTGSTQALVEYIKVCGEQAGGDVVLTMTTPSSTDFTTYNDVVSFIGLSDPASALTCNGKEVERTATGYFSFDEQLKVGTNTFTFEHKGEKTVYTVRYIEAVIKTVNPSHDQVVEGGVKISVSATALAGATLKATLGGQTVDMTEFDYDGNDSAASAMRYATYTAVFTMPAAADEAQELGKLTVAATYSGKTESKSGGSFTVRSNGADGDVSEQKPSTNTQFIEGVGSYKSGYGIKVGEGDRYVCEVKGYQITTLEGGYIDNRSRPTNSYLPAGTVDYCSNSATVFYDPDSGNKLLFRDLDYGKRIIEDGDVAIFKATLPETNSITAASVVNDKNQMLITFDTQWKAPFNVTYGGQEYSNPYPGDSSRPDYTIDDAEFTYVDIEFFYTVSGQGKVEPTKQSVFESAEWVKNDRGNYVLRLHLKKAGAFYGWTAQYNEKNQLEFYFLNPVEIFPCNNTYGVDLTGVTVMLDAGHGGIDSGAVGSSSKYTEAVLNLILANKVKRELERIGATVIMTRSDDTNVTLDERAKQCYAVKPDIFVSIHRNSSLSSATNGYENYYFYPFSKKLADSIYSWSVDQFENGRGVRYYPFRVTRMSCCPTVLTENGYMSNSKEMEQIKSDWNNEELAGRIVMGIAEYFVSIQL